MTSLANRSAPADERGIVLVIVALSITVLMVIAAIAIDGGSSYAVRRNMQNASDAGSMAGSQGLYKAQLAGAVTPDGTLSGSPWPAPTDCGTPSAIPATDVYSQVYCTSIVRDGGALPTDGEDFCDVIDVNGNTLGKCYDSSLANPEAAVLTQVAGAYTATGVKVVAENSRTTLFGQFAGEQTHIVRARAAASVQPVGGSGAPYVVCGFSGANPNNGGKVSGGYAFINPATYTLYPDSTLLPIYGKGGSNAANVNGNDPNAAMVIQENSPQDNDHDISCGAGSSTDGKGDGSVQTPGGWVQAQPGNGSNPNVNPGTPLGSCGSQPCNPCPASLPPASPCDILLPIADYAVGNGNNTLYHVFGYGVFHIETGKGNQKVIGWYDGHADLTTGFTQFGTCPPANAVCIVKLIDFPANGLLE